MRTTEFACESSEVTVPAQIVRPVRDADAPTSLGLDALRWRCGWPQPRSATVVATTARRRPESPRGLATGLAIQVQHEPESLDPTHIVRAARQLAGLPVSPAGPGSRDRDSRSSTTLGKG
jgi:hypothetical protein